jgi:hypothetical protein
MCIALMERGYVKRGYMQPVTRASTFGHFDVFGVYYSQSKNLYFSLKLRQQSIEQKNIVNCALVFLLYHRAHISVAGNRKT